MTPEEKKVWDVLKTHVGKDQAVSRSVICHATRLSDRAIRDIIRTLKLDHKRLIGFSMGNPAGYFVLSNLEEITACFKLSFAYEQSNRENRQYYEKVKNEVENQQMGLF